MAVDTIQVHRATLDRLVDALMVNESVGEPELHQILDGAIPMDGAAPQPEG